MGRFDGSASYARDMLARRVEQDSLFDVPLRSPGAWDILLVLYIADAGSRRLTGRQAIEAAGVGLAAGKRWLSYLNEHGLVIGDGQMTIDVIVTLAPHAITRLEAYIERCNQSGRRLG